MIKTGFIFLLVLCAGQSIAQKWISTSIHDRVKVDFPKQPEIQDVGNFKIFQIAEPDYVISVAINVMPSNVKFDPRQDDLDAFYKRVIQGALDAATNSKLLIENKIEIDGYDALEVTYTKDFNGVTGVLVRKRVLFVDRVLFVFDVWDYKGKGLEKLTKKFFKSIAVL
jgi:hypothetical protein